MNNATAIFLFDRTGNIAKPWAEAGVTCYSVDVQHAKGERREGNHVFVGADVRHWLPPLGSKIVFFAAFPPCTHLAVSGARWFRGKGLRRLAEAIDLFAVAADMAEWSGAPYLIENPVSVISSHWRKPDYTFSPWEYAGLLADPEAENTTKKTCLWTGGGFVMPEKRPAPAPHRSDVWLMPPSADRAYLRSATPNGFAIAVYIANRPKLP